MKFTRKHIKYGLIGILFVGLIGAGTAIYLFHMPHRDVLSEKAVFEVTATGLVDAFLTDQPAANKKYLDQVVAVTGKIAGIDKDMNNQTVILLRDDTQGAGVRSSFTMETNPDPDQLLLGEQIKLKGVVRAGAEYLADLDLVEHVILEKATIIK
jgi:hypothetical protein